ncbi:MAG: transcriptional regulator [Rhodobacterales bacterium]|nr:transcriptional regulator [Rhodobacterales bacterium]NCO85192.1 transcriptional regulator [Rhodobacterales bacterium]NCT12939.1 transcriptional regulator [Rhodobacterales bacterium]
MFQTYSKTWTDIYSQSGFVMHDPIVRWGFENTGAIRWSMLDDPVGVLEKARPHGLVYGFACAVENGGTRSVAGFARADREFTDAEIAAIAAQVATLHDETAKAGALSAETREELRQMSIRFTHP